MQRMSYFSIAMRALLGKNEMSQRELARTTEIDSGLLSRYLAGKVRPAREVLDRLCKPFTESERAQLIAAHLHDETPDSSSHLVRVEEIAISKVREESPDFEGLKQNFERLPKEMQQAVVWIVRAMITDNDAAEHFLSIYRILKNSI